MAVSGSRSAVVTNRNASGSQRRQRALTGGAEREGTVTLMELWSGIAAEPKMGWSERQPPFDNQKSNVTAWLERRGYRRRFTVADMPGPGELPMLLTRLAAGLLVVGADLLERDGDNLAEWLAQSGRSLLIVR